ncbi:MAG: hypothetical protein R3F43_20740 [bacterium]
MASQEGPGRLKLIYDGSCCLLARDDGRVNILTGIANQLYHSPRKPGLRRNAVDKQAR